jgi:putative DNA primase/helicase
MGWLARTGGIWSRLPDQVMLHETSQAVERLAMAVIQRLGINDTTPAATWKALGGRRKAADVLALLPGRLVESDAAFDAKPHKLNCPNGVVDLRSGDIRPHRPSDRFLVQTAAEYRPGAKSTVWLRALSAMDPEWADWFRLRLGQALTGQQPRDHKILFLKGGGQNGKSVVLDSVMSAMGGYATNVPPRVLLGNPSDHSTELMTLMGVRLAVIEELPEQHISGVRLKQLVGVKSITARRIAKDNVTFPVSYTMLLTTNYTPRITDMDHGTWRRLAVLLWPFKFVKAPMAEHERKGASSLQYWKDKPNEAVLAWLVAAAVECYANMPAFDEVPDCVQRATDAIRGENDATSLYAEEQLVLDQTASVVKSEVYQDYVSWASRQGQRPMASNTFAQRFRDTLTGQQVAEARIDNVRVWRGVRLRTRLAIVNGIPE